MSLTKIPRRKIEPTHPGEILREEFMHEYGLTVSTLAARLSVSRQSINELVRGRRELTPEMALRLAKLFGNSAEFWLNAQRAHDLWHLEKTQARAIAKIRSLRAA